MDRRAVRRPQGRQARRRGLTTVAGPAASTSPATPGEPPGPGRSDREPPLSTADGRRLDRPALAVVAQPRAAGLDGRGLAPAHRPLHGSVRDGDRDPRGGPGALGRRVPGRPDAGQPGPRAVRGRERQPRRAVRLAGHVRPDLPGHQPPRLRRGRGGRLVPIARGIHHRSRGGRVAGAGHPPRARSGSARPATARWGSSDWTPRGSPA